MFGPSKSEMLIEDLIGYIPLVILGLIVAPGIIYFFSKQKPNAKTTRDKITLYIKCVWITQGICIVPVFLIAILTQSIDFLFFSKVSDIVRAGGSGGLSGAIVYIYLYMVFYITIFIAPLLFLEKRLNKRIDRRAYTFAIGWFWATFFIGRQFIENFGFISERLFPFGDVIISQWLMVGFIILTITHLKLGGNSLLSDISNAFKTKETKQNSTHSS